MAVEYIASGCIIFAENMLLAANRTATEWEKRGIALAVISFVTLLHTFLPNWGVRGMNAIGVIKIVLLLFIVVTGWVILGGRVSRIPDPNASFRNAFAGSVHSGNVYATALFKVINSYAGYVHTRTLDEMVNFQTDQEARWSNASYVLNEVQNPVRTLKIAGPLGLLICGILYILANVSYYAAATPAEVAASGNTVAAFFMGRVFGHAAQQALA
jgi:amino acid transporter